MLFIFRQVGVTPSPATGFQSRPLMSALRDFSLAIFKLIEDFINQQSGITVALLDHDHSNQLSAGVVAPLGSRRIIYHH